MPDNISLPASPFNNWLDAQSPLVAELTPLVAQYLKTNSTLVAYEKSAIAQKQAVLKAKSLSGELEPDDAAQQINQIEQDANTARDLTKERLFSLFWIQIEPLLQSFLAGARVDFENLTSSVGDIDAAFTAEYGIGTNIQSRLGAIQQSVQNFETVLKQAALPGILYERSTNLIQILEHGFLQSLKTQAKALAATLS